MKTQFDLDAFLDQTFFGLDILSMLGDIEHYIEFSESNIAWQKQRELRKTEKECDEEDFDEPQLAGEYKIQMLDSVEYRFETSLKQRVRYAGLVALMTTFEWCMISLRDRAEFEVPKKPKSINEAVHLLAVFANQLGEDFEDKAALLKRLFHIRNCIVHAAGLVGSFEYQDELRHDVDALTGVSISNENFLGESVHLEEGFLEGVLEDAKQWLPGVEKSMYHRGLLRK